MKLFLRSFSSLPLIYSRRVVVSYKRKYVGKFKKNVTIQFFYPHALNMDYFYLN